MTPPTVHAAIEHLEWCATIPHTIDQVIGIHIEAVSAEGRPLRTGRTNAELALDLKAQDYSRLGTSSGHADPTPDQALRGHPDAVDDPDETIGAIRAAVHQVHGNAIELHQLCAAALGHTRHLPPRVHGLTPMVGYTISVLRTLDLAAAWPKINPDPTGDQPTQAHVDMVARIALSETAEWLHTKAEAIWTRHHGERLPAAVQKPIVGCTHCSTWRTGTIATEHGLCSECHTFRHREKCLPTESIIRRWDLGKAATPGQIIEARANRTAGSKPRRRSA